MIHTSHGQRIVCLSALTSLGALLVSGCSSGPLNLQPKGPSGSTTPAAVTVSTGAQLGLIWNATDATLRPLVGVPGSTQLGAPLFPAGAYVAGAFATPTQTALLIDPKGNLQVLALPATQPLTLTQGLSASSSILFAPRGAYAAVFKPGSTSVLLVSGLPQAPVVNTLTASAAIQGVAVSDQGTVLVAAGKGTVSVTAITSGGARSTLASLAAFGGMSFISGSEDSLVADAAANTLSRYHNGTATLLANHASGLNQPFAVAASQDGHWAVTADQADGILLRVDLTGATPPAQSTCACTPTQLSALSGNAVFTLAAPASAPGWMIEADGPASRVLFIPPARSGQ